MRKGKNRYIVEVNEWGCGLMIKDTQTGREIDAPDDEVITLCIKEMNSLAKELDTVRSVAEDNQAELKATRIENARLKAEVERLEAVIESHKDAGLRVFAILDEERRLTKHLKAEVERLTAFTTRTIIPNDELQAQVERLTKAGDNLVYVVTEHPVAEPFVKAWFAAKEGKQP